MSGNTKRPAIAVYLPLLCLLLAAPLVSGDDGRRFLLIVSGLGGEDYYSEKFGRWSLNLLETVHQHDAVEDAQTIYLAESGRDLDQRIDGTSNKSTVLEAIAELARRSTAGDRILLVLIGHGTAQGREVRFNLPGPDLSPRELADALSPLHDRRLALIIAASSSGAFVQALSAPGRVVITATADGQQSQATRFGGYFIDAMASDAADADKDGQVSLLEAFHFARRKVEQAYKGENRLQPEHALLDDNGDGLGSRQPTPGDTKVDGALAGRYSFSSAFDVAAGAADARLSLQREARRIVDRIELLKREKRRYDEADYETRLETMLVELALNRRAYRRGPVR